MTVDLPEDLTRELEAEVAAGRAKSVDAVVTAAVRAHLATISDLRKGLDEAEADYRANGGRGWDEVKARLNKRIADAD